MFCAPPTPRPSAAGACITSRVGSRGSTKIDKGDGFQRFESQVRGSSGKVYAQRVLIALHPRHAVISGVCDCPVGYACKHVVAACLAYLDGAATGPATAPGNRRRRPSRAGSTGWRPPAAGPPPRRAGSASLYLLQPAPSDAHAVAVELAVVRPLKGGGLSKGRRLNLANILYSHSQHAYVLPEDRDILAILRGISAGGWAPSLSLHGPLGQIALHRMVATGRCHWRGERHRRPLGGAGPVPGPRLAGVCRRRPAPGAGAQPPVAGDPDGPAALSGRRGPSRSGPWTPRA